MGPRHPHRLRLKRIEAKPKEVRFVGTNPDIRLQKISNETVRDLVELRRLISTGTTLPDRYYRPRMDRRSDPLLAENGILHLHLKDSNDDAIAYLVQYPDHVVIICIDSHRHLKTRPPGANLPDHMVRKAERELLAELGLDSQTLAQVTEED